MENQRNINEVFIEETFNARIEKVFQAWTDPEKLMKWYAPEGCAISFNHIEVKTGGKFHSCISNPQYGDCWCIGEYIEVIPNSKLVFTMVNADEIGNPINPVDIGMDSEWPGATLVTVTLTEVDGKTKLQLHQTVSQELAKKTGAYPSWLQMLDNLNSILN
ncbi:SRPBCC family protein [Flavobacterium sp.]|uniref:SRPBCC family protein n=1 Tax=Flavobacterium sp. TaxID=239 RepID=UPI0039E69353